MEKILTREEAEKLGGEHIAIPDGYTEIAANAFGCRDDMQSVEFPESVTKIGPNAFSGCLKLKSVNIPASVRHIRSGAFGFCENLESLTLSSGLLAIGGNAFMRCAIKSVTIPATVKYMYPLDRNPDRRVTDDSLWDVYDVIFAGCSDLAEINVDPANQYFSSVDGVLFTKDHTILLDYPAGKPGKTYIIPDGVQMIDAEAFGGCHNLEEIVIPDSVTEIEWGAFVYCVNLQKINIPASVIRLDASAFDECGKLADIPEIKTAKGSAS